MNGQFRPLHHGSSVLIDEFVGHAAVGGPWSLTEHAHTGVQVTVLPAGHAMRAHWVSDGGAKSERRLVGPAVCITPIAQPHSMEWDDAHGTVLMEIQTRLLGDEQARRADLAWTGQGLYGEQDPFLAHLVSLLLHPRPDGGPLSQLHVEATAVLLLHHLNQCHGRSSRPVSNECRRLHRVREFIDANLGHNLSLVTLAQIAHTSPFHFGRLFKAGTGLTPHQYVLNERIERAKRLLVENQLTIVEIAHECGFATQAHLTTAFRTHVGNTPKSFRSARTSKPPQGARGKNE